MLMREAGPADFEGIKSCVASTGYYHAVSPEDMGGRWLVACPSDNAGFVAGCVWLMVEAPNAYLDFLAVRPEYQTGLGVSLLGFTQRWLESFGVRFIRSAILQSNVRALRLGLAFGGKLDSGYAMLYWQGETDGN